MNARHQPTDRNARIATFTLIACWAAALIAFKYFGDTISRAY